MRRGTLGPLGKGSVKMCKVSVLGHLLNCHERVCMTSKCSWRGGGRPKIWFAPCLHAKSSLDDPSQHVLSQQGSGGQRPEFQPVRLRLHVPQKWHEPKGQGFQKTSSSRRFLSALGSVSQLGMFKWGRPPPRFVHSKTFCPSEGDVIYQCSALFRMRV